MLAKDITFKWGPEQQHAFDNLKKKLTISPVLRHPDPEQSFIVYTDVSDKGLGVALYQVGSDREEHPVYFKSKKATTVTTQLGNTQ